MFLAKAYLLGCYLTSTSFIIYCKTKNPIFENWKLDTYKNMLMDRENHIVITATGFIFSPLTVPCVLLTSLVQDKQ